MVWLQFQNSGGKDRKLMRSRPLELTETLSQQKHKQGMVNLNYILKEESDHIQIDSGR